MILVDTNIIIDFWKNPTDIKKEVFCKNDIATCGIIKAELIYGARSEKEITLLVKALESFEYLVFEESDWVEFGRFLNRLKTKGITIPFQDCVIAYLAIKTNCYLWTNDRHFMVISEKDERLLLYEFSVTP